MFNFSCPVALSLTVLFTGIYKTDTEHCAFRLPKKAPKDKFPCGMTYLGSKKVK